MSVRDTRTGCARPVAAGFEWTRLLAGPAPFYGATKRRWVQLGAVSNKRGSLLRVEVEGSECAASQISKEKGFVDHFRQSLKRVVSVSMLVRERRTLSIDAFWTHALSMSRAQRSQDW
jgi:hypothetical protein